MATSSNIQPIATLYGKIFMSKVVYEKLTSSDEVNKITILPDGTMRVNDITLDKIVGSDTTDVVLFGGNA